MNRRKFLKAAGLSVLCVTVRATNATRRVGSVKKPNLVFVFSDQQSWDMLGCYGNKDVVTPNLDRLAKQGIRFNLQFSNLHTVPGNAAFRPAYAA